MPCEACLDMEIRKLRPAEMYNLGNILSISDAWKKLMAIVPKQGNIPKFSGDHINIIEQAAHKDKRNAAQIFLDEWSTMGKKRPTLGLLLELLIKAELFRAADYIACDILKQKAPKRPDHGPAAPIDISDAAINALLGKHQIVPQNTFADSLRVGTTSELISEINKIFPCDNEGNKAVNENLPDRANNSLNSAKSTDIALSKSVSDLMKFSVTDTHDAVNKHEEHIVSASLSKSSSTEIKKEINSLEKPLDTTTQYYKYEELPSQELPVFLKNCK